MAETRDISKCAEISRARSVSRLLACEDRRKSGAQSRELATAGCSANERAQCVEQDRELPNAGRIARDVTDGNRQPTDSAVARPSTHNQRPAVGDEPFRGFYARLASAAAILRAGASSVGAQQRVPRCTDRKAQRVRRSAQSRQSAAAPEVWLKAEGVVSPQPSALRCLYRPVGDVPVAQAPCRASAATLSMVVFARPIASRSRVACSLARSHCCSSIASRTPGSVFAA